MNYSKEVMKRFLKPKFARAIKNPDAIGKAGSPVCGDVMEVYLKIEKERIKDVSFLTMGCAAAIASSEAMCELAKGKTIREAQKINSRAIVKKLRGLSSIKLHCSVLGEKALQKAIRNYKKGRKP